MTEPLDEPVSGLRTLHAAPADGKPTFVFVNALTGSTDHWEGAIAPALRAAGFGTLSYNLRGQSETTVTADDPLDTAQVVDDLLTVVNARVSGPAIFVGLSIGGLYATRAIERGFADAVDVAGLVLINTLRRPGPVLDWTNEAVFRATQLGGPTLVRDFFLPFLVGPSTLAEMRDACLADAPYEPLGTDTGIYALVERSRTADWNVAWDTLDLPVHVLTGMRDRMFLDRAAVDAILGTMPNVEETVFESSGHLLPIEDPRGVERKLRDFAARIAPAPASPA
ncbi:MAG: alpha/beta hydrolase [Pseudomonadota bacterium]